MEKQAPAPPSLTGGPQGPLTPRALWCSRALGGWEWAGPWRRRTREDVGLCSRGMWLRGSARACLRAGPLVPGESGPQWLHHTG